MRLLHVYSGNLFGGIESMLLTCARVPAAASGVDHEFALCFDERLASELRAAGCRVHLLGPVRLSYPVSAHSARQALARLLRRERYDQVICHAPWSQAIFGGIVAHAGPSPVFWAHDRMSGRHWTERIARFVPPRLVICNSRFTESTKPALYPGIPSVVVHPPVAAVPPARQRRYVRMSLDTPEHAVVIIQASRCEAWKGHRVLLDALIRLEPLPGWIWWLAGGPQRPEEEDFLVSLRSAASDAGIADRIRWLGQRADVPTLLGAADVLCQANVEPEPFGITFVEALHAGLPVVAAAHGGVTEVVDPSCGVLVPPGDPSALAGVLRSLVEGGRDGGRRHILAAAASARAAALCDPLTQVRRLAEVLDTPLARELAG